MLHEYVIKSETILETTYYAYIKSLSYISFI